MSWARGRRSLAISDRSGMAFPYTEMVKEWNGSLVHITEYEPKSPQIDPPYHKADAVALQNPRSQRFQQPKQIGAVSANSGGTMVGVANLTLPGNFAFNTRNSIDNRDNYATNISNIGIGMVPTNPSLQNRRRQLLPQVGVVEVVIS
jgi:hypothetical protein|tara:strand:- start:1360 stop:1800 length:441 start_codon:yes stop_codon:yes gene_type:complete